MPGAEIAVLTLLCPASLALLICVQGYLVGLTVQGVGCRLEPVAEIRSDASAGFAVLTLLSPSFFYLDCVQGCLVALTVQGVGYRLEPVAENGFEASC
jgi:hypothetical protein